MLHAAGSGVLNVIGLWLLYFALARGPVSIASPVMSSFTVMVVALNAATGAVITPVQIVATCLVFLGIAMLPNADRKMTAPQQYSPEHQRKTALIAFIAAFTITFRMFLAQESADSMGAFSSVLVMRLASLAVVAILLLGYLVQAHGTGKNRIFWPRGGWIWFALVAQAIFEMLAIGSFLYGSEQGSRVGAAVGFAPFSVVSALIAWLVFKEQISARRMIWILVVALGVILATLGSSTT
jgi:drug/metabolite transporter (DMT)-like permease